MQAAVKLDHQLLAVEGEHDVHACSSSRSRRPTDAATRRRCGSRSCSTAPARWRATSSRSRSAAPPGSLAAAAGATSSRSSTTTTRCACSRRSRPCDEAPLRAAIAACARRLDEPLRRLAARARAAPRAPRRARKVLLLTDGLANVGITERDAARRARARPAPARASARRRSASAHDFDEELLTAMADAGGGNAHYAATPEEAPAIFAQELEGLTSVAAQNVTVEIRPGPTSRCSAC